MGKYYFRRKRLEKIRDNNFEFRCVTPQSHKLLFEALAYEDRYFKDMTMQLKSIKDYYMCYYCDEDGKIQGKGNRGDPPYISISDWKIVEKKLRKREGYCNVCNLEIALKQGLSPKERKITFFHEMIHAYEAELQWAEQDHAKELVFIFLYKNLIKKVGEKKANSFLKIVSGSMFWESSHSVLFTLKSLDFDIRLKLPFGSVFSYGKTDFFPKNKDRVK
ncbi:MAG: hypothetical protein KAW45_02445 [Thermoplasmatales archaeon]|nr:hypothetical protein [Thermoplasmatales archaeon]